MSQQVNLYQPRFRKQSQRFSGKTILQAAALVVLGILGLYGYGYWQLEGLRTEVAQVKARHDRLAARVEEVSRKLSAKTRNKTLEQEIARLERLVAARARIQQILEGDIFANTDGYSEFLLALARQHVAGIWLTGFSIVGAGERLMLKGRTTVPELVPRYMQRLGDEEVLAGIEFQVFRMARPADEGTRRHRPPYVDFYAATVATEGSGRL